MGSRKPDTHMGIARRSCSPLRKPKKATYIREPRVGALLHMPVPARATSSMYSFSVRLRRLLRGLRADEDTRPVCSRGPALRATAPESGITSPRLQVSCLLNTDPEHPCCHPPACPLTRLGRVHPSGAVSGSRHRGGGGLEPGGGAGSVGPTDEALRRQRGALDAAAGADPGPRVERGHPGKGQGRDWTGRLARVSLAVFVWVGLCTTQARWSPQ